MIVKVLVTVRVEAQEYADKIGVPLDEVVANIAAEFEHQGDGLTWDVVTAIPQHTDIGKA